MRELIDCVVQKVELEGRKENITMTPTSIITKTTTVTRQVLRTYATTYTLVKGRTGSRAEKLEIDQEPWNEHCLSSSTVTIKTTATTKNRTHGSHNASPSPSTAEPPMADGGGGTVGQGDESDAKTATKTGCALRLLPPSVMDKKVPTSTFPGTRPAYLGA